MAVAEVSESCDRGVRVRVREAMVLTCIAAMVASLMGFLLSPRPERRKGSGVTRQEMELRYKKNIIADS